MDLCTLQSPRFVACWEACRRVEMVGRARCANATVRQQQSDVSILAAQRLGVDPKHFETVQRLTTSWQWSPRLEVGTAHV